MTIAEKIQCSADKAVFTLFKEGLFYKCYNEDTMVFVQNVKEYKISSKFVKRLGAVVLSLGFPVSEAEKGHLSFEHISEKIDAKSYEIKDKHIVFLSENTNVKGDYTEWIETIQKNKNVVAGKEPGPIYKSRFDMDVIINMIKNYDLANSTPMQGLHFIQQLKSKMYQIEKNNGNI